ncbi:hypothetical protein MKZ38_009116 [Zalerion maritima]|uniref:Uncharacterized protein n=1 Tax=Zalerion maritima TaxID=339359 RepID=A0AAD5WMF2_9PEZI|nr:hypothetical protein MKZ38_009116 [Zalerion maritima]
MKYEAQPAIQRIAHGNQTQPWKRLREYDTPSEALAPLAEAAGGSNPCSHWSQTPNFFGIFPDILSKSKIFLAAGQRLRIAIKWRPMQNNFPNEGKQISSVSSQPCSEWDVGCARKGSGRDTATAGPNAGHVGVGPDVGEAVPRRP